MANRTPKERWFILFGDGRVSGAHKHRSPAQGIADSRNRVHRMTVEQGFRIVPPAVAIIHAKEKPNGN